ncbi:MAG: radical SAM protein, partial [Elusimicrobia bacterium]|nr:radical SAM protein [Elusimicrobiota bacterium]
GLGYIAAVLERAGIEVRIVDCLVAGWERRVPVRPGIFRIGLSFDEIAKIIGDFQPDMVGANILFTTQRENGHEIFRLAKKADSRVVCVAGGAHPTVMPELVLKDENVDYVVLGEGEQTILDLVACLDGARELAALDGIAYKDKGLIKVIPKTRFIEDLDSLPFPARHLMDLKSYFGLKSSHGARAKNRFSPIITSRGCPAKCTFCSAHQVWGRRFRPRSPENIIAEMVHLKEEYGIEEIMLEDDNANLNPARAERLFDLMVEKRLDFVWDTPNGVSAWALTERVLDKMKRSGCRKVNLALETGNQHVMDHVIKKPVNLQKVKPLIAHARKIDLDVNIYLILGLPGETMEQMWDTFRLARELGIYRPFISIATPYPGSELHETCLKNGYLSEDFSLDDLYIRSFPISTKDWTGEQVQRLFEQGQRYLLRAYMKDRPLEFLAKSFRYLLSNPPAAIFHRIMEVAGSVLRRI